MPSLWELFVKISGDNSSFKGSMKDAEDVTKSFASTFNALDKQLAGAIGFASLSASAAGLGKFILDVGEKFQTANAHIQRATGASGASLEGLKSSLATLSVGSSQGLEAIGGALSQLSIRTGLAGAELEALAKHSLNFAKVTGADLVQSVTDNERLFQRWGVTTKEQSAALDVLYVASTKTGESVSTIAATLSSVEPVLHSFGFDFLSATALVASFEKAGLDAGEMIRGLNNLFAKFAAAGKEPKAALDELVKKIQAATTAAEGVNLAIGEGFSKRSATAFVDAVQKGAFNTGQMTRALSDARGKVDEMAAATDTLESKIAKLGKAIEDMAKGPGGQLVDWLGKVVDGASRAAGWLQKASEVGVGKFTLGALNVGASFGFGNIGRSIGEGIGGLFTSPEGPEAGKPRIPIASLGTAGRSGAGGLSSEELAKKFKTDFSALGLEDLATKLAEATAAYAQLTAAGKLNNDQIQQAQNYIADLRDKLAGLNAIILKYSQAKPFAETSLANALLAKSVQDIVDKQKEAVNWLDKYSKSQIHVAAQIAGTFTDLGPELTELQMRLQRMEEDAPKIGKDLDIDPEKGLHKNVLEFEHLAELMQKMGIFGKPVTEEMERINSALHALGISAAKDDVFKLQEAFSGLNEALSKNAITQEQYNRGFVAYVDGLVKAGVEIDRTTVKVYEQKKAQQENANAALKMYEQGAQAAHTAFGGISRDFGDMIATADYSWDKLKRTGQQFASDLYTIMFKSFFKPVEDAFAKMIGNLMSSLTGTATSAAGSAASGGAAAAAGGAGNAVGAAGGVAGAAVSGVTGVLGAIGSIGSFVTGIVGDIQNMHQTNLIGEIEVTSRKIYNEVSNIRTDNWSQFSQMYFRLGEVLNSIRATGGGNTFNFYGANIDEIVREMKLAGVLPS